MRKDRNQYRARRRRSGGTRRYWNARAKFIFGIACAVLNFTGGALKFGGAIWENRHSENSVAACTEVVIAPALPHGNGHVAIVANVDGRLGGAVDVIVRPVDAPPTLRRPQRNDESRGELPGHLPTLPWRRRDDDDHTA
jgi:hypothetical protein